MINVKHRILVDWDGDGSFNNNTKKTTPLNLLPASQGQALSGLRVEQADPKFEDIIDEDSNGLTKRRVTTQLGSGDFAEAGMLNWLKGQTRPGLSTNIVTDGSAMTMPQLGGHSKVFRVDRYQPEDMPGFDPAGYNAIRLRGKLFDGAFGTALANLTLYSDTAKWTTSAAFTDPAISTPTLVLTPSTAYKVIARMRILPFQKTRAISSSAITAYLWRSNGTTSPTLIVNDVDTLNLVGDEWQVMIFDLTTPATFTQYGLNFKIDGAVDGLFDWEVAGLMVIPASTYTVNDAIYFHDLNTPFRAEQFPVVLEANKAYRGAFYIRNESSASTMLLSAWDCELGTTNLTQFITFSSNSGLTTDWRRVEFAIPSRTYERGLLLHMDLTPVNGTIRKADFKGFMIWEGADVGVPFNTGTVNGYDDLTEFVIGLRRCFTL